MEGGGGRWREMEGGGGRWREVEGDGGRWRPIAPAFTFHFLHAHAPILNRSAALIRSHVNTCKCKHLPPHGETCRKYICFSGVGGGGGVNMHMKGEKAVFSAASPKTPITAQRPCRLSEAPTCSKHASLSTSGLLYYLYLYIQRREK